MTERRSGSGLADRRAVLKAGLGAAAIAPVLAGTSTAQVAAPAVRRGLPEVVVIGAGAMGAFTALTLRERGHKVTLVDAYGPGNPRQTSSDESRQIRYGYGDREVYTRTAVRSMGLWREREKEWGVKLLFQGNRLSMSLRPGPRLDTQRAIFDRLKLPYELWKHDELARRYPQVNFEGIEQVFVEPEAAMIMAKPAILKVVESFQQKGGTLALGKATPGSASGRRLGDVALAGGEPLSADVFVFACGPWLPGLFPQILGKKLWNTRCEVVYFGAPAGDSRFVWPNFPQMNGEMSTYPVFSTGIKVIPNGQGAIDLDKGERLVSPTQIKRARDYIARRVPLLKDAPIIASAVCQFEMASNQDFLIDRHPDYDNVWFAGGGSSHGFKHSPFLGEYIAGRVTGEAGDPDLAKLFSIADHKEGGAGEGQAG